MKFQVEKWIGQKSLKIQIMVTLAYLFEPSGGNYVLVLKLNELSYMTLFMKQK